MNKEHSNTITRVRVSARARMCVDTLREFHTLKRQALTIKPLGGARDHSVTASLTRRRRGFARSAAH